MSRIYEYKECSPGRGNHPSTWTKDELSRELDISLSYTKEEMCEQASWRAQQMVAELYSVAFPNIEALRKTQAIFLSKYLKPSPNPRYATRNEDVYGPLHADFKYSVLEYCRDGILARDIALYLQASPTFLKYKETDQTRVANLANTLNTLIYQAPSSPDELVLFRAVTVGQRGPTEFPFKETTDKYIDFLKRGVLSTSYCKEDAARFIDAQSGPCCLCVLKCPVGTHCLLVDQLSVFGEKEGGGDDAEYEVILPSGNNFRLQHSYFETVEGRQVCETSGNSVAVELEVRVLVCVLEGQSPNDNKLHEFSQHLQLSRPIYDPNHPASPPTHEPYQPPGYSDLNPIVCDDDDDDDD